MIRFCTLQTKLTRRPAVSEYPVVAAAIKPSNVHSRRTFSEFSLNEPGDVTSTAAQPSIHSPSRLHRRAGEF